MSTNIPYMKTHIEIANELDEIMFKSGMDPHGNIRSFMWLKELIMLSIHCPDRWQNNHLEYIGERESLTRERVRQILFKTVWNSWSKESKTILENHFGHTIQTQFRLTKPNHTEFIKLISNELREKYNYK